MNLLGVDNAGNHIDQLPLRDVRIGYLTDGTPYALGFAVSNELPVIGPCTVDVDAFEIVASSEEASEGGEFSMTSDMAIALKGKNAYEVWLETHEGTLADYETEAVAETKILDVFKYEVK